MNLKNNEFEWLLNHLGHTGDVHKEHYRQMSGLVERVYISKLLLVQDMNMTNKFTNQDLVQMDIRGNLLSVIQFKSCFSVLINIADLSTVLQF